MKCFNFIEKVAAHDFNYGSDLRKLLEMFWQTLSKNGCEDTADFISIEKLVQCQVIYISIGGWEYEIIFDLNGNCYEIRFQFEDGNYYNFKIKDKMDFEFIMEKMNLIIETVVVLDNMNRKLQNNLLNSMKD